MGSVAPGLRPDLALLGELVPPGVRLLDLGCGDGALLEHLARTRQVLGRGIELSEQGVLECVRRGLSVRQGDLQEGLSDYPSASFDYVVLSQTLPFLDDPGRTLREMLRVGRRAIVSLPNWGYWRSRLTLLAHGRMPQAPAPAPGASQPWHAAPRWQALTVADFLDFCTASGISIAQQAYLNGSRRINPGRLANLRATAAVFVLACQ